MEGMHLLLVDDDVELCALLVPVLASLGPRVSSANSVAAAVAVVDRGPVHIAVLDVQLPDGSGFSVASHLRRHSPGTGIVMLTRLSDPAWQVAGYDVGADVYLPKPISPDVLCAAVRSLANRLQRGQAPGSLETEDGWALEGDGWRLVAPDGQWVALNQAERSLVQSLHARAGQVIARASLAAALVDDEPGADSQRLDMLVHRLRRKVEAAGLPRLPLQAVRGKGYVLMTRARSESANEAALRRVPR